MSVLFAEWVYYVQEEKRKRKQWRLQTCCTWWGMSCVHPPSSPVLISFILSLLWSPWPAWALTAAAPPHSTYYLCLYMVNAFLGDKVLHLSRRQGILAWIFRGIGFTPKFLVLAGSGTMTSYQRDIQGCLAPSNQMKVSPSSPTESGPSFFHKWPLFMSCCESSSTTNSARKAHVTFQTFSYLSLLKYNNQCLLSPEVW